MQLKHINIVIIDGVERDMATLSAEDREDGSLISERDMDTMAEKDKDEAVNELNGNSVGYLGYQK